MKFPKWRSITIAVLALFGAVSLLSGKPGVAIDDVRWRTAMGECTVSFDTLNPSRGHVIAPIAVRTYRRTSAAVGVPSMGADLLETVGFKVVYAELSPGEVKRFVEIFAGRCDHASARVQQSEGQRPASLY